MIHKKKVVSFTLVLILVSFLGAFTTAAFATNEADDGLVMGGVSDTMLSSSENMIADEASGVTVEGEMPANVELTVVQMDEANYNPEATSGADEVLLALDITPTSEGEAWQPAEGEVATVVVDVAQHGIADGAVISVVHDGADGCNALGEFEVVGGMVTFVTDGFSDFYFYVKFEHGGYGFTLSGGGEAYLSEILEALNVGRTVDEVVSVEFSSPDLLGVERVDDDWLLTSLASFGTEEKLVVTFSDGEAVDIAVADPVIYNYAISSGDDKITNQTKLPTQNATVDAADDGDEFAAGKTFKVNETMFTTDVIKSNGTTTVTSKPAADAVHMRIYVEPGMALRFGSGIYFTNEGAHPTHDEDSIWYWAYSNNQACNYVIVKEGTAGKTETFLLQNGATATAYCNVQLVVVEEIDDSKPLLLEDALKDANKELGSNYSIKSIPVTLYNYDGKKWNEYHEAKGGNYLAFAGTVNGVSTTANAPNRGWTASGKQANGGGSVALMGILEDELDADGLPVVSQGQKVDLFSETSNVDAGKVVYDNVGFQFIYNEDTGYYSYNAAYNHAQYNDAEREIQLYKQSLSPGDIPTGGTSQMGNAGFFPFEDINKTFTNPGYQKISWQEWADALTAKEFEYIPAEYAADIYGSGSENPPSTVELHYGLQVDAQFYLPEGKKLGGEEMVYNFTGDDDLWVFIDGQLVLDIGGGHTHVAGSFNLTTGEVWVSKYSKLSEADGGSYETPVYDGTDLRYIDEFLTGLEDDQMHRIQIFYLERHAGISNCKMHFNLPIAPASDVEVSKDLQLLSGDGSFVIDEDVTASDGVHGAEEYIFTVYTAEDDDDVVEDESAFEPLKGITYTVIGAGIEGSSTRTTNAEDGSFALKAGQTAYFEDIPRFTEVYVVESTPSADYEYAKTADISVNSGAPVEYSYGKPCETKVVQKNEGMSFEFTNYMLAQDLVITKEGIEPVDDDLAVNNDSDNANDVAADDAEYQSTVFTVRGPSGEFEVVVHDNGSATIKDLVPGTYTISESNIEGVNWAWRYLPNEELQSVALKNADATARFSNTRDKGLWLSGDNWCCNIFKDGKVAAINALSPQENS